MYTAMGMHAELTLRDQSQTSTNLGIKVAGGEAGPQSQPARPDGGVTTKQVKAAPPQAEVFHYVKNLHRFVLASKLRLIFDDEIDVNIGMDEIPVCAAFYCALDTHQAMLLHQTKCTALKVLLKVQSTITYEKEELKVLYLTGKVGQFKNTWTHTEELQIGTAYSCFLFSCACFCFTLPC